MSTLPSLLTDIPLALSGRAQPMQEAYLGSGSRCRAQAVINMECDLEVRARVADGTWQSRSVSFASLFGSPVEPSAPRIRGLPTEPYWLTVDVALDSVANRVLLLVAFVAGAMLLAGRFLRAIIDDMLQPRRLRRALSGHVLVPVLVQLVTGRSPLGRHSGAGLRVLGDSTGRKIAWRNPRGEPLFALDTASGGAGALYLGVASPETTLAMPLDEALAWIDLTEAERQRLRVAARQARR